MKKELQAIGKHLIEQKYAIAETIFKRRLILADNDEAAYLSHDEQLLNYRTDFIDQFGKVLIEQKSIEAARKQFGEWGEKTGEAACVIGISLDEALRAVSPYRQAIWEALKKEIKERSISADVIFYLVDLLDSLIDEAVYTFSLSYIKYHQETLEKSNKAFLELSIPVVPITKGVAVLPLIGNLDESRAAFLMEEVLEKASRLRLNDLLIDLSGVPVVDTMIADQIFKVVEALSLLGVQTSLIGIRPEVAQTMVTIGIQLGGISIKANLETALRDLQKAQHIFS